MTAQEIRSQIQGHIYEVGSIPLLKIVHDALVQIGKHDPLSEDLAEKLEDLILWQEEFPVADEGEE